MPELDTICIGCLSPCSPTNGCKHGDSCAQCSTNIVVTTAKLRMCGAGTKLPLAKLQLSAGQARGRCRGRRRPQVPTDIPQLSSIPIIMGAATMSPLAPICANELLTKAAVVKSRDGALTRQKGPGSSEPSAALR